MVSVWILTTETDFEGGHVNGVFGSEDLALREIGPERITADGWVQDETGSWSARCSEDGPKHLTFRVESWVVRGRVAVRD